MSRRSRTVVVVDNISGHLFPETAEEKACSGEITTPQISGLKSASSDGLGERSDTMPSVERGPVTVDEVANSGHEDVSGQRVDPDEAASQPRPNDLVQRPDDAGDSIDRSAPSDDATMPSKNSDPHDCAGAAPPSPEESDGATATDSHSCPASQDGRGEFADGSVPSAGIKQMGGAALAVQHGDSHKADSIVAPEDTEDTGAGTNHIAREADKETVPARSEPAGGQAVPRDGIKDGLYRAGTSLGTDDQPQTADSVLEAGDLQQGGESQETEQAASTSEQCAEVPTSATGTTTRKSRQSHPKVIVKERDYLNNSEEEILDRLIALNAEQHEVPQTYPSDEVEAGYKDLKTANVTCTKTVQRNIPKLMEKGFIDRVKEGNEIRAGSRARYRINSEDEVKRRRSGKGLTHYVEIGLERKAVPDPEQRTESGA